MKSAGAIQKIQKKGISRCPFSLYENAADKLILLVLLGSVLLFILWPIACIALRSLRGADGGVSFAMFGTVLRQYGESLRNSVFVGVFTAVLSTILSLSAALVCATARGWKKTLCMIIMLVAMVSPPFVSSLAYIQLYGRRGWITYRLLHLSLNPYNRWGVILMQSISFVPLNAMFLSGILESWTRAAFARRATSAHRAVPSCAILSCRSFGPRHSCACCSRSSARSRTSARPSSSAGASARWPRTSICKSLDTRTLKSPRQ